MKSIPITNAANTTAVDTKDFLLSSEDALNEQLSAAHLVCSFLTHHCHDGAALAFIRQWQGIDTDLAGDSSSNELLRSTAWLTMEHRKCTAHSAPRASLFPSHPICQIVGC